jgi:UrcA family protein
MHNTRRIAAWGWVRVAVVAATASGLSVSVAAGDITGRDVTVSFADLDANTLDGAAVLLRRIESAANRVCAALDHGDLASRSKREACELKLTAAAVSRVDLPALATVYRSAYLAAPRVIARAN